MIQQRPLSRQAQQSTREDAPTDEVCQECEKKKPEPVVTVRLSVFFDGTGNNRFNADNNVTEAGESNVSKMERCCPDEHASYDHYGSVYIEGAGTLDNRSDDWVGSGTGTGGRGVYQKVMRGIALSLQEVSGFGISDPIVKFDLDVVGFSRGAAQARNFVWRMMLESPRTLKERLVFWGYDMQCDVQVKFLGLYDTVSSYGTNHDDDVEELNLEKIYMAETIVQLAAAEEHRKNFQLTTIKSGTQLFLPGVHSDVGGGYADGVSETDHQLVDIDRALGLSEADKDMFRREYSWFVDRGWFDASELQNSSGNINVDGWNQMTGTRGPLTNSYSRIPLQLMVEYAEGAGIKFLSTMNDGDNTIDTVSDATDKAVLKAAERQIRAGIGGGKCGWSTHWMDNKQDWHKKLRHKHLHLSARYGDKGGAHQPNWYPDDPVTGKRIRYINVA